MFGKKERRKKERKKKKRKKKACGSTSFKTRLNEFVARDESVIEKAISSRPVFMNKKIRPVLFPACCDHAETA